MIAFLILLCLLIAIIVASARIFNKAFNPISIINSVFVIWMILGRIGFGGQFVPTFESSVFLETNLIVIDLFTILGYVVPYKKRAGREFKKSNFNSGKFFIFFRVVCLAISILVLTNLARGLISGEFSVTAVREISYSTRYGDDVYAKIYFNSFIYYFYQYVVRGFILFDLTYNIAEFIMGRRRKISIISIFNFILFLIIMQSRIEFMKFVIFSVIFFLFSGVRLTIKQKINLKRSMIVLLIAAIVVFAIRSITSSDSVISNTASSFLIDFSGSNYTFSTFFANYNDGTTINDAPIIFKYLGGMGRIIEFLLAPFGFSIDHSYMNTFLIAGHNIGSSDHYNAFYTMYFGFLNSGGYAACYIFSVIFGFLVGHSYKRGIDRMSPKYIYIATFVTYIAVMGTYDYILSGIPACVMFACVLLVKNDGGDLIGMNGRVASNYDTDRKNKAVSVPIMMEQEKT